MSFLKCIYLILFSAFLSTKMFAFKKPINGDGDSYVILKSGEKIFVKRITIQTTGVIGKIEYYDNNNFEKEDVREVQNKSGYYKKFDIWSIIPTRGPAVTKDVDIDNVRFAKRITNGSINLYRYSNAGFYTTYIGAYSEGTTLYFFDSPAKKVTAMYIESVFNGDPRFSVKIEAMFSDDPEVVKMIADWRKLSHKQQRKCKTYIYFDALDKYNLNHKEL